VGPAGTAKPICRRLRRRGSERDAVKRIIPTRPAVEVGERLLPGRPMQRPIPTCLHDALYDLLGFDRTQKNCLKAGDRGCRLVTYARRTLNHASSVRTGANTTVEQMMALGSAV
jgi:phosphate starvation-inducible PhoH-like protein